MLKIYVYADGCPTKDEVHRVAAHRPWGLRDTIGQAPWVTLVLGRGRTR